MTDAEKEEISAKIDSEGFEYYFVGYGADERLLKLCGSEINGFIVARNRLVSALHEIGIDIEY